VIDRDVIAVPVSGDLRLVVIGAPAYFAAHAAPTHPRECVNHQCINWHPRQDAPPYKWEFTENGRDFAVDVNARVLTNDPVMNVRLAVAGAGITMTDQNLSREPIERGELVPILEEFSTPFPGYFLYYPQRRHASAALRAFVEYLHGSRRKRRLHNAR